MGIRHKPTRREFIKTAAATIAVPYIITSKALGDGKTPPASERIVMAGIGIGNMGHGDQNAFLHRHDVQYVAVCDVRKKVREMAKSVADTHYGNKDCKAYNDFREILARPDIDAVHIATPDHWHAIIAVNACRNGKDVYCQKPETRTLREGPLVIDAARRYSRVFSGGSQRVLGDYRSVVDKCWGGEYGTIKSINVNVGPLSTLCNLPAEPVPADIDWDMWLGPAPWAAYNHFRCDGNFSTKGNSWRSYRDYSGGAMTDWGAHHFGGATFAANVRELQPVEVIYHKITEQESQAEQEKAKAGEKVARGKGKAKGKGKGKERVQEVDREDNAYLTYRYPNGFLLTHNRPNFGNLQVEGTPGEKRPAKPVPLYKGGADIYGDFIYCVKTRERPFRDIELAVNTITVSHLGIVAYDLKRSLKWDAATQQFPGDEEANRFLDRARREPWQL